MDAFGDVAKRAKNPMTGSAPTEGKGREDERRNSEEEPEQGRMNRFANGERGRPPREHRDRAW